MPSNYMANAIQSYSKRMAIAIKKHGNKSKNFIILLYIFTP